jgi:hypothetical protein
MITEFSSGIDRASAAERSKHRREAVGPTHRRRQGPPCPVNNLDAFEVVKMAWRGLRGISDVRLRSRQRLGQAKRAQCAPLKRSFPGAWPATGQQSGQQQKEYK